MILSYTLILPKSQLQTQQLMTSQIRSYIEYLTQTYNILVLILYSKFMRNVAALAVFDSGLLFWATQYTAIKYCDRVISKFVCSGLCPRSRCLFMYV